MANKAPSAKKNVVLIGYRGSGKTATGKLLAKRLGLGFVDTDLEVERKTGRAVRDLFHEEGEPAFRKVETQAVRSLAAPSLKPVVMSVGGGAVMDPANARLLRRSGWVVWLDANGETLVHRLEQDARMKKVIRPLLNGAKTFRQELEKLLPARRDAYARCCDLRVATDGRTPAQVAAVIEAALDGTLRSEPKDRHASAFLR